MSLLPGLIAALYAIALISLAFSFWQAVRLVKSQPDFVSTPHTGEICPPLDVIVPVKDEENEIGACIESILAQDYPGLRLIVVNDRSTDRTAQVVQTYADKDPRLTRLDITELPAGLFGKPHALHQTRPLLRGEVLIFVDSDFHLRPGCLRSAVQHLTADRLDWMAMMGSPELDMFWERLLVPIMGAMAYAWYDPRSISDPDSPDAIGSGFICVRRAAYEAIGGHESVIKAYDEDSALLRLAKAARQKVAYVLAPDLFTLRFYGGLKKTLHGITRTCIGGIKTIPRMLITLNALNFISLLPLEIAAGLGIAALCGVHVKWLPLWLTMAIAHYILAACFSGWVYSRARAPRWLGILHPLAAAMMVRVCLRATKGILSRGPITWRGTTY
jgi:glycosyltransferase involved in cell wall biosynthesis